MGFAPPAAAPPVVAPGPGDPDDATTWDGLFSEIAAEVCGRPRQTEVEESEVPGAAAAAAAPAAVEAPAAAELEAPEPRRSSPRRRSPRGRRRPTGPPQVAVADARVHLQERPRATRRRRSRICTRRSTAADFKKAPETLASVGDLMALKPHVDERRYEATLDAAAWADAAAALEDAALAKTLFLPIAERGASPALLDAVAVAIRGRGASAVAAAREARARGRRARREARRESVEEGRPRPPGRRGEGVGGEADRREAEARLGADKKERKRLQQQEKRQRQAEKKRLAADRRAAAPCGGDLQEAIKRKDRDAVRLLMADRGARERGAPAPAPPPPAGATVEGFLVARA
ncbi:VDE lipocalin domain-containing protein [Aureococcus anophagefferens]|nr:VDE lipocalin domain-containing protein [Aureococcus anophagefferens]